VRISTLYLRFYKAFNFDYLRKSHSTYVSRPWDRYRGLDYPYISIELDEAVTWIVGANESGKSQLLTAIQFALESSPARPQDFCRYSDFFTSSPGTTPPHFGIALIDLTTDEVDAFRSAIPTFPSAANTIRIFKESLTTLQIFVDDAKIPIETSSSTALPGLPRTFGIDTDRALPDSVPITYLVNENSEDNITVLNRANRLPVIDSIVDRFTEFQAASSLAASNPAPLAALVQGVVHAEAQSGTERATEEAEFRLARNLLIEVAGVELETLRALKKALREEKEGYVNALTTSINEKLSSALNLRRWWTQDEQFELCVTARDGEFYWWVQD
jgi:hypothetical protein